MHDGVASKSNIGPKRSPLACSLGSTLAFRHDAVDSAVVGIKTTPGIPLACVVYHDGTLALYDFETNVLLGQVLASTDQRSSPVVTLPHADDSLFVRSYVVVWALRYTFLLTCYKRVAATVVD